MNWITTNTLYINQLFSLEKILEITILRFTFAKTTQMEDYRLASYKTFERSNYENSYRKSYKVTKFCLFMDRIWRYNEKLRDFFEKTVSPHELPFDAFDEFSSFNSYERNYQESSEEE